MENIIRFTENELTKYTLLRSGEVKFGERMEIIPKTADIIPFLRASEAEFVLIGIPEDIGIRANFGRPGAAKVWESTLKSLANLHHNKYNKAGRILVLGHIDVADKMAAAENLNPKDKEQRKELMSLVEKIDKDVSHVVCQVVKAGKYPIIVGGGQNNAYGNIKGLALAKGKAVNAINFDSSTDFKIMEGRHSSNGFSYAFEDGFLKNYFVFGLHENYTSKGVLENIKKHTERVQFNTYEQIAIRKEKHFSEEMALAQGFIANNSFGIELDLSALQDVIATKGTPTGFSVEKARQFVHYFGKLQNAAYLHICEGNIDPQHDTTGKLITYLITDFIKSKE
ncbi:arginase [Flavobacterium akiainvivens]|uniref:Arginase n=1 Tax=Flavobacterium akiainvivens TaxID=1202724 RepID=A0A0M9VHF2_9FLAO|nr:formimidoylglutamase [Flavobacterium akiainvivens]KOS05502.1 arginase [Flavobacterium akiainvivens]SFQ33219.1 formiminoglutamase [Flavobacterium akiainvivens]